MTDEGKAPGVEKQSSPSLQPQAPIEPHGATDQPQDTIPQDDGPDQTKEEASVPEEGALEQAVGPNPTSAHSAAKETQDPSADVAGGTAELLTGREAATNDDGPEDLSTEKVESAAQADVETSSGIGAKEDGEHSLTQNAEELQKSAAADTAGITVEKDAAQQADALEQTTEGPSDTAPGAQQDLTDRQDITSGMQAVELGDGTESKSPKQATAESDVPADAGVSSTQSAFAQGEEAYAPSMSGQTVPNTSIAMPSAAESAGASSEVNRATEESSSTAAASSSLPTKQDSLPPPPVPVKVTESVEGPEASSGSSEGDVSKERQAVARAFGAEGQTPIVNTASTSTDPATPSKLQSPARSPTAGLRIGKGPPPPGSPSEEKPFDFNRFLEQMKDPSARGVGEYVRSFIKGFAKKPYRTSDQIKLIFDFLDFIGARMRQTAIWASLSETDFENATEAMEKLVMNRLYAFTFTPAVAKEGRWSPQTDDLEKDRVLRERIELFSWIKEEHLDVPTGDHSRGFVEFAIQELLKINHYKAPRDKLICILNCCKVIFGLIRHLGSDENADTFVPILIFVVLKANPEHLISNVEYIGRFRNPEKLSSESGYYLSSLMGATAFIETMDYSSLSNIDQAEFERNVEEAIQKVGTRPSPTHVPAAGTLAPEPRTHNRVVSTSDPHAPLGAGEEAAHTLSGPGPTAVPNFAEDTRAFLQRTGEAARVGFIRPIGALGKLLGEGLDGIRSTSGGASPLSQSNSAGGSPSRVESPGPGAASGGAAQQPRRGVFSGLLGSLDTGVGGGGTPRGASASSSVVPGYNPASWSRSFRDAPAADEDEPQTPLGGDQRQGPFSSLVRNPDYSNVAPGRKIGETPYAPKAHRNRPAPVQRADSMDPFSSPDPGSAAAGDAAATGRFGGSSILVRSPRRRGGDGEDDIGTPSDSGSEDDNQGNEGGIAGVARAARSRFPDLGSFVPSFLSEQEGSSSATGTPSGPARAGQGQGQFLRRGPNEGRPAYPGQSSLPASSDADYSSSLATATGEYDSADVSAADVSADVERVHAEQFEAGVETLKSVFPDVEDQVRRLVLEASGGDVAAAIDRLLAMND